MRHSNPSAAWQPVLDARQRDEALSIVESIARDLTDIARFSPQNRSSAEHTVSPALAAGAPGVALFFAFRERVVGRSEQGLAVELLGRAADELTRSATHFGLYGGLAGLSWTLRTIQRLTSWAAIPEVDVSEMVDHLLRRADWKYYYDLTDGLLGVGVCVLGSPPDVTRDRRISSILRHLDDAAEYDSHGVYWSVRPDFIESPVDSGATVPYVNMGLAHGVPSIVAWLAMALESGCADEAMPRLLSDATNWLIGQADFRRPGYAYALTADSSEPRADALGWCYGDLGVASAIALAGHALHDDDWLACARKLALATTTRVIDHRVVPVAGLCHGASGLGHLYHRLYRRLGDDALREAAIRWYATALRMHRSGIGVGGYSDLVAEGNRDDPGFLRGAAGIGLALMAAVSDVEPTWDQALLLSSMSTLHDA